jgi:hypothetical protein
MKGKILIASAATLIVVAAAGSAVAWAAGSRQEAPTAPGKVTAMHAVCQNGNVEAMKALMTNLTDEDWQEMAALMASHMGDGAHGDMMSGQSQGGTSGMMGSGAHGGMMGSGAGGMMGGSGMMGSGTGMMSF